MDEGWPGFVSTRSADKASVIYHVRADNDAGSGAPYALGCCGIQVSVIASDIRLSTRTIMYMITRLRLAPGKDIEGYPFCAWLCEDGNVAVRVGHTILWVPNRKPGAHLPEAVQQFIEQLEDELDRVFP